MEIVTMSILYAVVIIGGGAGVYLGHNAMWNFSENVSYHIVGSNPIYGNVNSSTKVKRRASYS